MTVPKALAVVLRSFDENFLPTPFDEGSWIKQSILRVDDATKAEAKVILANLLAGQPGLDELHRIWDGSDTQYHLEGDPRGFFETLLKAL